MKRNRIVLAMCFGLGCTGLAQAQGPDSVFIENVIASPGDTVEVRVRVKNSFDVVGITLPLIYTGTGATLISGTAEPRADTSVFILFSELLNSGGPQTALYGFISFLIDGMRAGDGDLMILKFAIAADAPLGVITIDTTSLPPANILTFEATTYSVFPEFVMGSITVGGQVAGDLDCDNEVTVGDIIYLVNFIFKSGPEPCLPDAADVDCDGQLAVSDAIYLVNYLFRGGPSPGESCFQQ